MDKVDAKGLSHPVAEKSGVIGGTKEVMWWWVEIFQEASGAGRRPLAVAGPEVC